jgi:4-hydroxybenzoate polyprenyltransferase
MGLQVLYLYFKFTLYLDASCLVSVVFFNFIFGLGLVSIQLHVAENAWQPLVVVVQSFHARKAFNEIYNTYGIVCQEHSGRTGTE